MPLGVGECVEVLALALGAREACGFDGPIDGAAAHVVQERLCCNPLAPCWEHLGRRNQALGSVEWRIRPAVRARARARRDGAAHASRHVPLLSTLQGEGGILASVKRRTRPEKGAADHSPRRSDEPYAEKRGRARRPTGEAQELSLS